MAVIRSHCRSKRRDNPELEDIGAKIPNRPRRRRRDPERLKRKTERRLERVRASIEEFAPQQGEGPDWIMPIGKFRGVRLAEIGRESLAGIAAAYNANYLKSNDPLDKLILDNVSAALGARPEPHRKARERFCRREVLLAEGQLMAWTAKAEAAGFDLSVLRPICKSTKHGDVYTIQIQLSDKGLFLLDWWPATGTLKLEASKRCLKADSFDEVLQIAMNSNARCPVDAEYRAIMWK